MKNKMMTQDVQRIRRIRERMAQESGYHLSRYLEKVQREANQLLSQGGIRLKMESPVRRNQAA